MKYPQFLLILLVFCHLPGQETVAQSTQEKLKQMRSAVTEKIDGRDYYIHTIKRGQTLYMISKAYGVEVNDIISENPGVKEGIRADQKLRIPFPGQKKSGLPKATEGKEKGKAGKETGPGTREPAVNADSAAVIAELPCGTDSATKKPVYNIALMLPLYLAGVDQIDTVNPDPGIFESAKSFQFLPYYEGFRMAVDSVTKLGLKIRLYVYDVGKDTARTRQLLRKPEMKTMDLIFGLIYQSNFQIVAAFAKKNRINLVNPVSERSELVAGNPYIFKAQPPKKNQFGQLAAYMSANFTGSQVLIIRNGSYSDRDAPERLLKECQERNLKVQVVEGPEAAIGRLSKEMPNWLVAFSADQMYSLELLKSLYQLRNEYSITLAGLPNWPALDGLETEYLVALKTIMMARSFIDYNDPGVKKFVRQYQDTYKTDPELLAFEGFDQGFYFLSAIKAFGTNIGRCIGELKVKSMQTTFDFTHVRGNGFENIHWAMYQYENYRMVRIDQGSDGRRD